MHSTPASEQSDTVMELGADGLETARIRLAPFEEADREDIHNSKAVDAMWTSMPVIATGNSLDAYFDHTVRMGELGIGLGLTARDKADGALVGLAAFLLPNRLHRRIRIGYIWVKPELRGTGITDHVHFLMLKRAMEWRARRVEWFLSTRNQAAITHVERLGALREGLLRQHSRFADGSWSDIVVLSLVDAEIRAAMKELGTRIGEIETASGA